MRSDSNALSRNFFKNKSVLIGKLFIGDHPLYLSKAVKPLEATIVK